MIVTSGTAAASTKDSRAGLRAANRSSMTRTSW